MLSSLETIFSCCPQVGRNGHDGSQEENEVIGVSGNEMVSQRTNSSRSHSYGEGQQNTSIYTI